MRELTTHNTRFTSHTREIESPVIYTALEGRKWVCTMFMCHASPQTLAPLRRRFFLLLTTDRVIKIISILLLIM